MAKMGMNDLPHRAPMADRVKLDATTDEDIRRHKAEDGYGQMTLPSIAREVPQPRALRIRLALIQQEMAGALKFSGDTQSIELTIYDNASEMNIEKI